MVRTPRAYLRRKRAVLNMIATLLERSSKGMIMAPPTALTAQQAALARKKRALRKGKAAEAEDYIQRNELIPSSWVLDLQIVSEERGMCYVHAHLGESESTAQWYTYLNVPLSIAQRWRIGDAATKTEDPRGGYTGRYRKQWVVGKSPSAGAFFNQYIKNRYSFRRGRVWR